MSSLQSRACGSSNEGQTLLILLATGLATLEPETPPLGSESAAVFKLHLGISRCTSTGFRIHSHPSYMMLPDSFGAVLRESCGPGQHPSRCPSASTSTRPLWPLLRHSSRDAKRLRCLRSPSLLVPLSGWSFQATIGPVIYGGGIFPRINLPDTLKRRGWGCVISYGWGVE